MIKLQTKRKPPEVKQSALIRSKIWGISCGTYFCYKGSVIHTECFFVYFCQLFDSKCSFHAHNKNFFKEAVNVRYVRFIPTVWTQSISMRVEIIGRDGKISQSLGHLQLC